LRREHKIIFILHKGTHFEENNVLIDVMINIYPIYILMLERGSKNSHLETLFCLEMMVILYPDATYTFLAKIDFGC
jgi:hypothetical protein